MIDKQIQRSREALTKLVSCLDTAGKWEQVQQAVRALEILDELSRMRLNDQEVATLALKYISLEAI